MSLSGRSSNSFFSPQLFTLKVIFIEPPISELKFMKLSGPILLSVLCQHFGVTLRSRTRLGSCLLINTVCGSRWHSVLFLKTAAILLASGVKRVKIKQMKGCAATELIFSFLMSLAMHFFSEVWGNVFFLLPQS